MTQPLHYRTASEVAAGIAAGDLDSTRVTEALLARIERLEPKLHAYVNVMGDAAMERAAAADAERDGGGDLGPLHGVPVAVKDVCQRRGFPTTGGHSFLRGTTSEINATVVSRLETAGAVIVGKLATAEGAMAGYHRDFQVPRNPWGDLNRWPGSSSSGSGVGTASGLCYLSLGTDTGGSIRYPSAVNGLVGLKPTWGRVSRHGVMSLAQTLDHVGPITRSVRDAARVLAVIAGHDENDTTSILGPVPDYEAEMEHGVVGLRVGWDEAYATEGVELYVADAVRAAIVQLAAHGAEIIEVEVPTLEASEDAAWFTLVAAEASAFHESTFPGRAEDYGVFFQQFLGAGRESSSMELAKATIARKRAAGRMAPLFLDIDVLASPTLATESFRYDPEDAYGGFDAERQTVAGEPFAWFARSRRFLHIWDFNGYPTLSLPCGFSPDGMPLSLQLVGAPLDEAKLCRAGFAFEQAHDFQHRHPDV